MKDKKNPIGRFTGEHTMTYMPELLSENPNHIIVPDYVTGDEFLEGLVKLVNRLRSNNNQRQETINVSGAHYLKKPHLGNTFTIGENSRCLNTNKQRYTTEPITISNDTLPGIIEVHCNLNHLKYGNLNSFLTGEEENVLVTGLELTYEPSLREYSKKQRLLPVYISKISAIHSISDLIETNGMILH